MDTGGLGSQGKGSGVPEVRLSEEGCEEDQARMAKLGSEVVLSKKKKEVVLSSFVLLDLRKRWPSSPAAPRLS